MLKILTCRFRELTENILNYIFSRWFGREEVKEISGIGKARDAQSRASGGSGRGRCKNGKSTATCAPVPPLLQCSIWKANPLIDLSLVSLIMASWSVVEE